MCEYIYIVFIHVNTCLYVYAHTFIHIFHTIAIHHRNKNQRDKKNE